MSQYRMVSIWQRNINIINYAQEGVSLISRQGAIKKKNNTCLCQHQGRPHEQNDLDQGVCVC